MNTRQRITVITLVFVSIVVAATLTATAASRTAKQSEQKLVQARVQRGEYLVTIGGCHDCHTPFKMGPKGPEPDMRGALSGHPESFQMPAPPKFTDGKWLWAGAATNTAFAGPWGVSYARNLTPERLTGIGIWDEKMFMQTIRTGRHWGVSRPILPPMPWFNYAKMTDEDLKSVYAYLRTLKPVKNQVPEAIIAQQPR
jgi:mono/diheme cytochrome c family protein